MGAGIYVLIGKVAAHAGIYTPIAFLFASFIALFTAISYAELSSRFPKSAGEAFYIQQAFHKKWLSGLIGWLVVTTGVISAAAITRGFVGYFQLFIPIEPWLAVILVIIFMGVMAIWGIKESAIMMMVITLIEISGLLIIIFLAANELPDFSLLWQNAPTMNASILGGILSGAFIAFYAYIGFEDMVNIVEEVKEPEKNLPSAIFWALGIATLLYVLVSIAMLTALSLPVLSESKAPLAAFIVAKGYSPRLIGLISLIAIVNGGLAQVIMASRVIYGMAFLNNAPRIFAKVSPLTQTPVLATGFVLFIILVLALGFDVERLAALTSMVILCVFILVNGALIQVKLQKTFHQKSVSYPIFFPITGGILSLFFLASQVYRLLLNS